MAGAADQNLLRTKVRLDDTDCCLDVLATDACLKQAKKACHRTHGLHNPELPSTGMAIATTR